MAKDNRNCGVGVAYNCNLGGIKFNISAGSDLIESYGLGRLNNYIQVYSNSWGPNDFGFRVDGPGYLTKRTLKNGALNVRSYIDTCSLCQELMITSSLSLSLSHTHNYSIIKWSTKRM